MLIQKLCSTLYHIFDVYLQWNYVVVQMVNQTVLRVLRIQLRRFSTCCMRLRAVLL